MRCGKLDSLCLVSLLVYFLNSSVCTIMELALVAVWQWSGCHLDWVRLSILCYIGSSQPHCPPANAITDNPGVCICVCVRCCHLVDIFMTIYIKYHCPAFLQALQDTWAWNEFLRLSNHVLFLTCVFDLFLWLNINALICPLKFSPCISVCVPFVSCILCII